MSVEETFRTAGAQLARVLQSVRTADLPVVEPTKFELAINLKTAKALGFAVPSLLIAPRGQGDRMAAQLRERKSR